MNGKSTKNDLMSNCLLCSLCSFWKVSFVCRFTCVAQRTCDQLIYGILSRWRNPFLLPSILFFFVKASFHVIPTFLIITRMEFLSSASWVTISISWSESVMQSLVISDEFSFREEVHTRYFILSLLPCSVQPTLPFLFHLEHQPTCWSFSRRTCFGKQ